MLEIGNISGDSFQTQTVTVEGEGSFYMELYFIPMQYMWNITKITYKDFELKNMRVCNSANILHQFKNILPFGIACVSNEDREPMFVDDFVSGVSKLYILNKDEIEQYGDYLSGE